VLLELLRANSPLILDGAMGTELQRRGTDTGLPMWSANALIARPDVVLQIHKDYLNAGADIITTNTFRTTRRTMRRANLPDRSLQLTRTAVELAQRAREECDNNSVLVAGSIAPLEDCYRPDLVPPDNDLRDEHTEIAERLSAAGVDFLLLETMNTIREAYAACEAAKKTGKEVVVSFVCNHCGELLSGESLSDAVKALAPLQPSAFSINCVSPRFLNAALKNLQSAIGPSFGRGLVPTVVGTDNLQSSFSFGIYGNIGVPESRLHGWEFTHDTTPDQYALHARDWHRLGASIIGGCCGTTPEYIAGVAGVLGKL